MNDRPDVAEETRQRVQQIMDQLGYQPNSIARSLTRGKSHTLGVVGYGLEFYGPSQILSGIEKEANQLGYTLLLNLIRVPEREDVKQLIHDLLSRQVDGIIWAVPEIGDNRSWLASIKEELHVPLILLSTQPRPDTFVVNVENRVGGRTATEHLLAQDRRLIGVVTGPAQWWDAGQRTLGWQDALQAAGRPVDEDLIIEGDWTAASGERALHRLIAANPAIDAVFACNDQMALGVMRAAHSLGRRIPDDLAVVGFDDIPEAAYFYPSLTTMRQNVVEMGRRAVKDFADLLRTNQKGLGANERDVRIHRSEPKTVLLKPQLIVRESSQVRRR